MALAFKFRWLTLVALLWSVAGAAQAQSYYRWAAPLTYTCTDAGPTGSFLTSSRTVEHNNTTGADQFRLSHSINGVSDAPSGLFALPAGTGSNTFGGFSGGPIGFPFTYEYVYETVVAGTIVYRSSFTVTCTAPNATPVNAVITNQVVNIPLVPGGEVSAVPTLSEWMLAALAAALCTLAMRSVGARRSKG